MQQRKEKRKKQKKVMKTLIFNPLNVTSYKKLASCLVQQQNKLLFEVLSLQFYRMNFVLFVKLCPRELFLHFTPVAVAIVRVLQSDGHQVCVCCIGRVHNKSAPKWVET